MEPWLEHVASEVAWRLSRTTTKYASLLEDDQQFWWDSVVSDLISYRKVNQSRFGDLTEVVFRLGDFRINIYTKSGGVWMNCKWTPITPQDNEIQNMAEAFVSTLNVRFTEHKELEGVEIDDWFVNQLQKRGLQWEFASFLHML